MAIWIKIKIEQVGGVSVRGWRRAVKVAFREGALLFLRVFLPLRFKAGYRAPWIARRTLKYLRRKAGLIRSGAASIEAVSAEQANVLTGLFRDRLTGGDHAAKIRVYQSRCNITFKGPSYVRQKPRRGPDMFREVVTLSAREKRQLERFIRRRAVEEMKKPENQPQRRTRTL